MARIPMTASEEIELKLYRHISLVGRSREWCPCSWGDLLNALGQPDEAKLVATLRRLHGRNALEIQKWHPPLAPIGQGGWLQFETVMRDDFFAGQFQLRVAPEGHRYFEHLELPAAEVGAPAPPQQSNVAENSNPSLSILPNGNARAEGASGISVFISHNSRDEKLASMLIGLIRSALNLSSEAIRCTSVEGFLLPAGMPIAEQLRKEVLESKAFIALLTPSSVESAYVLFELGARWGSGKPMIPLLANGEPGQLMKGPLSVISALRCDRTAQLQQFVQELARHLESNMERPAVYQKSIEAIVEEVRRMATADPMPTPQSSSGEVWAKPRLKWGCYQFEGEEGLFCTACYDLKRARIQTTRLNSSQRACPVCKAVFGTG
jgi:hypothetical protein